MDIKKAVIAERIDDCIRYILYLLVFLLPFGKAWVEICFIAGLTLLIVKKIYIKKFEIPTTILNTSIAFFVIAGALSVLTSTYFSISLKAFFTKLAEGVVLFFLVVEVVKTKKHLSIIKALILSAAFFICLNGMIQYFLGFDVIYHRGIMREGITSTMNHPNDLAGYLLLPFFLTAAIIADRISGFFRGNPKKKVEYLKSVLALLLFALISAVILLTKSRGAFVGMAAGVLLFSLFIKKRLFLLVLTTSCVLLVLGLFFVNSNNLDKLRLAPDSVSEMAQNRLKIYLDVVDMIKARPVFGHGLNTFMRRFEMFKNRTVWTGHMYAHNCYLQMAAEMGIVGLGCFLWILSTLFYKVTLSVNKCKKPLDFLLIGLMTGIFAFLVHSFLDTNLYSLQLNAIFWIFIGLSVAAYQLKNNEL